MTDTNKWKDSWFMNLNPSERLLWVYLCDTCDICGYMEFIPKYISMATGIDVDDVQNVSNNIGDRLIWSDDKKSFLIRNFLKHQKNLPLKDSPIHKGIIKKWYEVAHKFPNYVIDKDKGIVNPIDRVSIPLPNPIDTLSKGYRKGMPTLSIGLGKGTSNSNSNSNFEKGGVGEKTFVPDSVMWRKWFSAAGIVDVDRAVAEFEQELSGAGWMLPDGTHAGSNIEGAVEYWLSEWNKRYPPVVNLDPEF
jgi:hypothetical protein